MRKTIYLILFLFGLTGLFIVLAIFIREKKNIETVAKTPLPTVAMVNPPTTPSVSGLFYGVSVDMSQILPNSIHYVRNKKGEDLIDIAQRLGVNLFRITNSQRSFENGRDSIYSKKDWDMVLNKMQKAGIKALILVETSNSNNGSDIKPAYLDLVQRYLLDSHVLDNNDVYAVDLKNEPVINENNLMYLKEAAVLIRSKYPKIMLTVGWWSVDTYKKDNLGNEIYSFSDYEAGNKLEDIVDFYSLHLYGFDKKVLGIYPDPYSFTDNFISSVANGLNTQKSILIEEFGAGNGSMLTDQNTLGSKDLQANAYEGVYQAVVDDAKTRNLLGTIAYVFYPRDKNTNGWNILDENGNYFYPAAYVLQKYATLEGQLK